MPLVAVLLVCGGTRRCPSFTDETPYHYATHTVVELEPFLREAVTKNIEARLKRPWEAQKLGMEGNKDVSITLTGEILGDRMSYPVRRGDGSYHYSLLDVNFRLSDPENGGGQAWVTIKEASGHGCYVAGVVFRERGRVYY